MREAKEYGRDYNGKVYVDVHVVLEPDNPYDEKAIEITLKSGKTIGYLSRADAQEYARGGGGL